MESMFLGSRSPLRPHRGQPCGTGTQNVLSLPALPRAFGQDSLQVLLVITSSCSLEESSSTKLLDLSTGTRLGSWAGRDDSAFWGAGASAPLQQPSPGSNPPSHPPITSTLRRDCG